MNKINTCIDQSSKTELLKSLQSEAVSFRTRTYDGMGIITASEGSKRILQTLTSVSILRKSCCLPIELFYADEHELSVHQITLLTNLGVTCINIQSFPEFTTYNARNFSIKALAIYLSSFNEVIWMDADVIALTNFENLFKLPSYIVNDHLFFEDIFSYYKNENAMTKTTLKLYTTFGIQLDKGTPETDSGLFILNKKNLPRDFIKYILVLNMHHKFIYNATYGDKELYRLSMMLCDKAFNTNDVFPTIIGKYFEKEDLMCGNGVVLQSTPNEDVAIHMTLHSVDHHDKYNNFWASSFWSHWVPFPIDVDLRVVEPINQEIVPKYRYDYKRVKPIPVMITSIQIELFRFIRFYENDATQNNVK
jgi:hypothetical protein